MFIQNHFQILQWIIETVQEYQSLSSDPNISMAEKYLTKYGYMKVGDLEKLELAIKDFQGFAGLKVTGELNEETVSDF